ncbi:MAG: RNA pseudouridine synthase [Cryomorphaceae bacterium]|nr:RNA pseudouridine synthase [Cryomorphaceae bacterium]
MKTYQEKIPFIIDITSDYIVVDKPGGLVVDSGQTDHPSLTKKLENVLKSRGERISKWGIHPLHFIDRAVAGLVIYARKKSAFTSLQAQFLDRSITKVYLAKIVHPLRSSEGSMVHYHRRSSDGKVAQIFDNKVEHSKRVDLRYRRLDNHTYEILLGSGKYHQIRAQLSHEGSPIVGDTLYDGSNHPPESIALICHQLTFVDDKTGERKSYTSNHSL